MRTFVATTPGLYPLPDWAKEELSDLKGHQKGDLISGDEGDDVTEAYDRARRDVVDDQRSAGLDRVVEGQLRWDDMLAHPLTVHDSVETGGIVRYYDNNNFYRDPQVRGELTPSGDVAAELEAAAEHAEGDGSGATGAGAPGDSDDALQAVLPGPYSLADLATDEFYGDDAEFADAVAEFLAGEVREFPDHETLFLLEPSLVENPPGDGADERASEAIDAVASATDADVVVHTYWGAIPEKAYAHLMDADVSALGVDLIHERDDTVYNVQEYGAKDDVALGVVDGQNTRVEEPDTVRERVEWFEGQVPSADFDTVYATANTELFYLPVNKYQQKLEALARAAEAEEVEA